MGDKMEYTFYNDAWIPPNINPDLSYAIKTDIEISGSDDFSVNNLTSSLVLKRNKDGLAEYITKDKYVQFLQYRITKLEEALSGLIKTYVANINTDHEFIITRTVKGKDECWEIAKQALKKEV
jgi:predicted nuclease of restriction endonuclease-like (RecB) superfamily